jgi:hypothetical protein
VNSIHIFKHCDQKSPSWMVFFFIAEMSCFHRATQFFDCWVGRTC